MTILTSNGSFAKAYMSLFDAKIVSIRKMTEADFIKNISKARVIIHNAASIQCDNQSEYIKCNFDFTRKLVDWLEKYNPNVNLIFLSSMSILDNTDDAKYANTIDMSPYAYSKYLAETYCLRSQLKNVSCIRFSTLFYGDRSKDGLSNLIYNAVNDGEINIINNGEATRNFIPIEVAAKYVKKVIDISPSPKRTYNIASIKIHSYHDIAKIISNIMPNVRIIDNKTDSKPVKVLDNFNTKDIKYLGEINFSIDNYIEKNIIELMRETGNI